MYIYSTGDDQILKWLLPNKQRFLNSYVTVIKDLAYAYNYSYVDIRALYLEQIPLFKTSYPGFSFFRLVSKANYYVTYDGEHPNEVSI